ncbi:MAG: Gldg family protein [Alphaproteobacteria bacterium]|nr:Gldg family protein [Alphaproteobacteria bacterium]
MNRRAFAVTIVLALAVAFVSLNLIAANTLKGARLDLTQDRLYSLSSGTRTILGGLNEPVELKLYWSRSAAAERPALRAYAARVREMLQTYAARSRDMVRIVEVDPERYSAAEDEAVRAGLEPIDRTGAGDPIYLGVVGSNAVDEKVVAPVLPPEREPFLEYDLTRIVSELEEPQRLTIALVTALPIADAAPPYWLAELRRAAKVERVAPDFTALPDDADLLLVVHPPLLNEAQLVALDQFVMAKGRAVIAVDPAAVLAAGATPLDATMAPPPAASQLDKLLGAWGVSVTPDIVMDRAAALPLTAGAPPNPLFFEVTPERIARDDVVTAALRRPVNLLAAGALLWTPPAGVTVTPLLQTTRDTLRAPPAVAAAAPSSQDILAAWRSADRVETVAARVSGALPSAFASTAPLKRAVSRAEVVVLADVDTLDDRLYVDPRTGPARDNASFLLNAIDVLGGSDELVSLRSRAPSLRRLSALDDVTRAALATRKAAQARLEQDLATVDARLAQLRLARATDAEPSAAEIAEFERIQRRADDMRAELRSIERAARQEVERRERLVVLLDVWAPPVLVALIGLVVFWLRMRRVDRKAPRRTP